MTVGLELETEYIQSRPSLAFRLLTINQSQVVIHDTYDRSKWTQMKWMQPRAKVQHLPVLADGQAAGFCGQSQGGGEKDTGAREICLNFKEN